MMIRPERMATTMPTTTETVKKKCQNCGHWRPLAGLENSKPVCQCFECRWHMIHTGAGDGCGFFEVRDDAR